MRRILVSVLFVLLLSGVCLICVLVFDVPGPDSGNLRRLESPQPVESTAESMGRYIESENSISDVPRIQPNNVVAEWRQRPVNGLDSAEYMSLSYQELRHIAESGDGRAAAWLAALLASCSNFPTRQSNAEIDAAIAEMRHTHKVPSFSNGEMIMQDFNNHLDALEPNIEVYAKRARRCGRVPAEHRDRWQDWSIRALVSGNMDDLVHSLFPGTLNPEEYEQLLSDLWTSGEPTALVSLSAVNLLKYRNGTDPRGQIQQLAYQLAAQKLIRDFSDQYDIPPETNWMHETLSDEIQHLRAVMRAGEISEAERLADQLIDQNENCCFVWPDHYFIDH